MGQSSRRYLEQREAEWLAMSEEERSEEEEQDQRIWESRYAGPVNPYFGDPRNVRPKRSQDWHP